MALTIFNNKIETDTNSLQLKNNQPESFQMFGNEVWQKQTTPHWRTIFSGQADLYLSGGNLENDFNYDWNTNDAYAEVNHGFGNLRTNVPTQVEADLIYAQFDLFKGWVREVVPLFAMDHLRETNSGSNIPWHGEYYSLLRQEGNALVGLHKIFLQKGDGFFVRVLRIRQFF